VGRSTCWTTGEVPKSTKGSSQYFVLLLLYVEHVFKYLHLGFSVIILPTHIPFCPHNKP